MKKNNLIYLSNLLIILVILSGCGSKSSYYDQVALVAKDESKGDYGFVNLKGSSMDFNFNKRPAMMHKEFHFLKMKQKHSLCKRKW